MNVAVTWYFASVPRMLCTPSAFAPASNVSATTLAGVGTAVQFWPPNPGGAACVAADAAGSGPHTASAPAAINASGPARDTCLVSLLRACPAPLAPFISITTHHERPPDSIRRSCQWRCPEQLVLNAAALVTTCGRIRRGSSVLAAHDDDRARRVPRT